MKYIRPAGWEKIRVKRGHPHGPSVSLKRAAVVTRIGYEVLHRAVMGGAG